VWPVPTPVVPVGPVGVPLLPPVVPVVPVVLGVLVVPGLVVLVWAAVRVAVMAGGGAVPGGDSAAWAVVWLSRNIPPAPAARIRPRWMTFMTWVSLHR
jgi:hypothetical protein